MKFLVDFIPILCFFVAYKFSDIYIATAVAIVATILQVSWTWITRRKVEKMHLITLLIILVFGGATLLFHDETFIKWKPTVLNWAFALILLASQFLAKQPLLQNMMGGNLLLPAAVWTRLNLSWIIFFILLGVLNLYVAFNYPLDTWVNFKVIGMTGLIFLFAIAQAVYLSRHIKTENSTEKET